MSEGHFYVDFKDVFSGRMNPPAAWQNDHQARAAPP